MSIGNLLLSATTSRLIDWDSILCGNLIDNGAFDIWQRYNNQTGITKNTLPVTADRWIINHNYTGTGTCTINALVDSPLSDCRYSIRVTHAGANATATVVYRLEQKLLNEILYTISGKTVTIGFWMKTNKTSAGAITVGVSDHVPNTVSTTITGTTSWAFYEVRLILSTITRSTSTDELSDVALGTFFIGFTPGGTINATEYIQLTGVSMHVGNTSVYPFKRRWVYPDNELYNALRYYQKSFTYSVKPLESGYTPTIIGAIQYQMCGGAYTDTAAMFPQIQMIPHLFRIPTSVVLYNPTAVANTVRNVTAGTNRTATVSQIYHTGFNVSLTQSVAGGDLLSVHYTADTGI